MTCLHERAYSTWATAVLKTKLRGGKVSRLRECGTCGMVYEKPQGWTGSWRKSRK